MRWRNPVKKETCISMDFCRVGTSEQLSQPDEKEKRIKLLKITKKY